MGTAKNGGQRELFASPSELAKVGVHPTADISMLLLADPDDNRVVELGPGIASASTSTRETSRAIERRDAAAFEMVTRRSGARRR